MARTRPPTKQQASKAPRKTIATKTARKTTAQDVLGPKDGGKKKKNTAKPTRPRISYAMEATRAPIYRGATSGPAKLKKSRPGMAALREIRHYQRATGLLMLPTPFRRLIREMVHEIEVDFRMQSMAADILQTAAEGFLVAVFTAANLAAIHAKRVTIMKKDMDMIFQVTSILGNYIAPIREIKNYKY